MLVYRVERPLKEQNAVVIYPPDGSMPAYIPDCANYAFRMLQDLAAEQGTQADECSVCHKTHGLKVYILCERHAIGL